MASTTLPIYAEKEDTAALSPSSTKPTTHPGPCHVHGPSQTPILEAQVADTDTRARLQALSSALADATKEGVCLKCVTENITQTLTTILQDVRTAKKSGQWSREEKKALKAEVKDLFKGMKHDLKHSWRGRNVDGPRPVACGLQWKR